MKTIICESHRRNTLLHELGDHHGVKITSLSEITAAQNHPGTVPLIFTLAEKLKKRVGDFSSYANMFAFPAFFEEVLSFARELALYGISPEELPDQTQNESELKAILSVAISLDLKEKEIHDKYPSVIAQYGKEDVKVDRFFQKEIFYYDLLQDIIRHGAEYEADQPVLSKKHLVHALSIRSEIEAAARDICENRKPANIILADPSSQLPVLMQVFSRYGIPYSTAIGSESVRSASVFRALVRFGCCPSAETLLKCITVNAFDAVCDGDLLVYLRRTLTSLEAPAIVASYEYFSSLIHAREEDTVMDRDLLMYKKLEEKAERYFAKIEPVMSRFLSCHDGRDILRTAYETLSSSSLVSIPAERNAVMSVYRSLQESFNSVSTKEDALFLAETICTVSGTQSTSSYITDFCMVTDLTHPVSPRPYSYILGCIGQNYPGIPVRGGIFDEDYVSRIDSYPSLARRSAVYMEQLKWLEASGTEYLCYSYHTNDYQGRENMPAFEIETLSGFERTESGKIIEKKLTLPINRTPRSQQHSLSSETARELFTRTDDNGQEYIRGSISSIESWFNCPYRYFIASGLYARKQDLREVSASETGTIQHAVLENAIKQYGKNYADMIDEEFIRSVIEPYFSIMKLVNPHDAERISLNEERLTHSLLKSAAFLKEYEKESRLSSHLTEHHFDMYSVSEHVKLNGTIDRISMDEGNHILAVIDYKSSAKKLEEKKVKAGLQLQLLSYLFVALDQFPDYEPGGAYYFSLKNEDIDKLSAAKVSRTGFTVSENTIRDNPQECQRLAFKERKLDGWTTTLRRDVIDDSGDYVSGMRKIYDPELIRECMDYLYEYFYSEILSENEDARGIKVDPSEHACDFCDYRSICRFHGEVKRPSDIYEGRLTREEMKKDED